MYHLLEWVRHNRLIHQSSLTNLTPFWKSRTAPSLAFYFSVQSCTRNKRNPVRVKVKHIKTRKVCDINLVTLLNSSTVIQWNRRMPIPTIKRFIKRYDKAQARADYLTTL